jgi:hypothetical protein
MHCIVKVKPAPGYVLEVEFSDGPSERSILPTAFLDQCLNLCWIKMYLIKYELTSTVRSVGRMEPISGQTLSIKRYRQTLLRRLDNF